MVRLSGVMTAVPGQARAALGRGQCFILDGIVALMTEDAWLRMPPVPLEYQGRQPEAAGTPDEACPADLGWWRGC